MSQPGVKTHFARLDAAKRQAAFAADPRRRAMIARIKIAQKEIGLEEDDYRELLWRAAGARSAADMSEAQLGRVLDELKRLGWVPALQGGRKDAPKAAPNPAARKARALWLSLHLLGAVRNGSEAALEAFGARQLGVDRIVWADQARVYKLIEALKAMAVRAGWPQDVPAGPDHIRLLKVGLVRAIAAKLRAAGAVTQIPAYVDLPERALERLSADLGRQLAAHAAETDASAGATDKPICNIPGQ